MTYNARVLGLDGDVEESVTLDIQGRQLTCFAALCPYPIIKGGIYPVELRLYIFKDLDAVTVHEAEPDRIERIGGAFCYRVVGFVSGGKLSTQDIVFDGEEALAGSEHLEGRKASIMVDRLDVEFLQADEMRGLSQ